MEEKTLEEYSYSKLDTYCQCPFRYWLKYVDGHYISGDSLAFDFGTLVHATEESIALAIKDGKPIDYVDLKNKFILRLVDLEYLYTEDFFNLDKSGRNCREKAYSYLRKGIYRLEKFMNDNPNLEIVGAEINFDYEYQGRKFHGFIDRVFRDKNTNKYIIQDIKTYPKPIDKDKLVTPLQFVVYSMAAKQLFNCEYSDLICQYDLPLCDLTQTVVDNMNGTNLMTRGLNSLNNTLSNIDSKEFKSSPSPLCHWCEFCITNPNIKKEALGLCPYFSHWTKENRTFRVENKWEGLDKHAGIAKLFQMKYNIKMFEAEPLPNVSGCANDETTKN